MQPERGARSAFRALEIRLGRAQVRSPPIRRSCLRIVSIAEVDERRLAAQRTGDEPVMTACLAGLLNEVGEPTPEAGSRRRSLETGGGCQLRASAAEALVDRRRPEPRSRRWSLTRPASIEVRRCFQASARGHRVERRQRRSRLSARAEKALPGGAPLGGLARFGGPPRTERHPLTCLVHVQASPVPPKFGVRRQTRPDLLARLPNTQADEGNRSMRWCS